MAKCLLPMWQIVKSLQFCTQNFQINLIGDAVVIKMFWPIPKKDLQTNLLHLYCTAHNLQVHPSAGHKPRLLLGQTVQGLGGAKHTLKYGPRRGINISMSKSEKKVTIIIKFIHQVKSSTSRTKVTIKSHTLPPTDNFF